MHHAQQCGAGVREGIDLMLRKWTTLRAPKQGRLLCSCGTAIVAGTMLAGPARSQILDQYLAPNVYGTGAEPGVTVTSRQRPYLDYRSVRLGSVVIRPEVAEALGYDDNVLGTSKGRGSVLAQTTASLQAGTNWSRHGLTANVNANDYRYLDMPRQSYTNWSAGIGGTYDIGRDTVSLGYSHVSYAQNARGLDVPQLDRPIETQIDSVRVSYRASFNRFSVQPGVEVARYQFQNGTVNGQPYLQRDRDRTVVTPAVIATYELAPRRNLVAVLRDSQADYRTPLPGAPKRNYNDVAALAGLDYDVNGVIRFRLLGGYQYRSYSSPQFKTIASPVAEGSAIWTPTGLTTVTGTLSRRIQDSADETTVALTETAFVLSVDHEYLRNVLLNARAGVYLDDYAQNQGSQTLYAARLGATWLLNRNVRLAATYDFSTRQSSNNTNVIFAQNQRLGGNYTDNTFLLQVRFGL
jgi:hypothetical protein